jgi:hypothetical protein
MYVSILLKFVVSGLLFRVILAQSESVPSKSWKIIEGYDLPEPKSLYFQSLRFDNFTCPTVTCSKNEFKNGYAYFMAATSHSNTYEMLVFRVCRYLQTCK